MQITSKFNLADTVYYIIDVNKGNKIPLIIEEIQIEAMSELITIIKYRAHNNEYYPNSIFFEKDLLTLNEANVILETKWSEEIEELQSKIDNI